MRKSALAMILILASAAVFAAAPIGNCTSFSWETEDGSIHYLGRTYDFFGKLEQNAIAVVNEGYDIALDLEGTKTAEAEYGYVGKAILGFPSPIMVDGMNEKGLAGCLLNFPGYAYYETQQGEGQTDVHPAFFLTYILGTCASVDEVEDAVKSMNLTDELIMGSEMMCHYILSDATGEAIVVEPEEDGIKVYRNTIGVLANAPGYQWHLTNLKGYVAISNLDTPPRDIAGMNFTPFGQGTGGLFGLPGSYSSPSRFVRMAFVKEFTPKGTDEIDGVTRMFNAFAPVTIPDGMLKESPDHEQYEMTLCTTVMCLDSKIYYFSPFSDRRISAIDVPKLLEEMGESTFETIKIPMVQDVNYLN